MLFRSDDDHNRGHEDDTNNDGNDNIFITPNYRKITSVNLNVVATTLVTNVNVTVTNNGWDIDDDIRLDDDNNDDYDCAIGAETSDMIHPQTTTIHPHPYDIQKQQQDQLLYGHSKVASSTSSSPYTKLEYELHDYIVSIPQVRIAQQIGRASCRERV